MNITNLDKGEILVILYNNARRDIVTPPTTITPIVMSVKEARDIVNHRRIRTGNLYFDYLKGRIIRTDLTFDTLDLSMYNSENGINNAEVELLALRATVKETKILVGETR